MQEWKFILVANAITVFALSVVVDGNETNVENVTQEIEIQRKAAARAAEAEVEARVKQMQLDNELHSIVRRGHVTAVESLIIARANVNYQMPDLVTPLMNLAASPDGDSAGTAKALIDAKADVDMRDNRGRTALWHAVMSNNATLLHVFDSAGDKNPSETYRVTPLNLAVRENKVDSVEILVEMRADLFARDAFGGTPYESSKDAHVDMKIKKLFGTTPLHVALRANDVELVAKLVEAGADMYTVDVFGGSPYESAKNKDVDIKIKKLFGVDTRASTVEDGTLFDRDTITKTTTTLDIEL